MKKGGKATAVGRWTDRIVRIGINVPGKAVGEEPAVNTGVLDSVRWKNFCRILSR